MKGGLEELQFKVSIEDCGKGQDCRPNDPNSARSKEIVRIYHILLPQDCSRRQSAGSADSHILESVKARRGIQRHTF